MKNIKEIFQQGFTAHKNGSLEEAADQYQKVLSIDPENPSALHLLGLIEFDRKNYESAIPLVEKSLTLSPKDLQWLLNYGKIMETMGRYELSISSYEKALLVDPNCHDAKIALADIFYKSGRFTEASKLYYKILCDNPNDRAIGIKYTNTLKAMGNPEQADQFPNRFSNKLPDTFEEKKRAEQPVLPTGVIDKTRHNPDLIMRDIGTQPTESSNESFYYRLSDLKVIDIQEDGTVKIIPINESPNYLCLLKLDTPEFDEIYNEYERRQLLLNKNYMIKGAVYYLKLLESIRDGFDFKKREIKVSNNVVWEGHHRVCILYYLYGSEFKLSPDFIESKKAKLVISTSQGKNIYIDENSVITQDFIMPEFVPGVTDINDWIKLGINGFKEWYQPVDFGNGIVAHVTTPPDWKPAPEWDQHRGLAKWDFIVERHIPDVSGKRILDLGCNNGIISLELAKKGAGEVVGIDRDAKIRQRTFDCLPEQDIIAQANFVKKAFEIINKVDYPVTYLASDISAYQN